MAAGVLVVAASLLVGWAALWPERKQLGVAYHGLAYPVGLLIWPLAGAASTALRIDFAAPAIVVGFGALLGSLRVVQSRSEAATSPLPFALTAALLLGTSAAVAWSGLTIAGWDSIVHYELPGLQMVEARGFDRDLMGEWAPLLPSMHAANRLFGGDWTHVPYPLLAGHLLVLLGWACHRFALSGLPRGPRLGLSVLAPASLAVLPSFAFHALHVHSQMVSATYLLVALVGLRITREPASRGAGALVAGLGAAGLALSRPDGLAYFFVPGLLAAVLVVEDRWSRRDIARYAVGSLLVLALPYLGAFSRIGIWGSRKLRGDQAALLLGAAAVATLLLLALPKIGVLAPPRRLRVLLFAGAAFVVAAVAVVDPAGFSLASKNMVTNLLSTGGYGRLWWGLLAGVAVAGLFPRLLLKSDFAGGLGLALVQFFAIAVAVHALTFPGRLHPADSFNRVAFHSLPLFAWFLTAFVGAAAAEVLADRD